MHNTLLLFFHHGSCVQTHTQIYKYTLHTNAAVTLHTNAAVATGTPSLHWIRLLGAPYTMDPRSSGGSILAGFRQTLSAVDRKNNTAELYRTFA